VGAKQDAILFPFLPERRRGDEGDCGFSALRETSWRRAFRFIAADASHALADEAQAFVGAGWHREREGHASDPEMPQGTFPADMGDLDAVGGEEVGDLLIAGVATHGFGELESEGSETRAKLKSSFTRETSEAEVLATKPRACAKWTSGSFSMRVKS